MGDRLESQSCGHWLLFCVWLFSGWSVESTWLDVAGPSSSPRGSTFPITSTKVSRVNILWTTLIFDILRCYKPDCDSLHSEHRKRSSCKRNWTVPWKISPIAIPNCKFQPTRYSRFYKTLGPLRADCLTQLYTGPIWDFNCNQSEGMVW